MTLLVKLGLDSGEFGAGIDNAQAKAGGFGKFMGGVGKGVLAVGAMAGVAMTAAAGAIASTIGPASDLAETTSKVGVVFGDWSEDVIHFGDSAAESLGMSSNQAMAATATYGNLFKAMGIGTEETFDMSTGLVQLASDLASFNNSNPQEVLDALRSGLSGETEPLKKLGVNLNQALVEQKALDAGLWDGVGTLSAAAKAQATYALVMEQTTLAQGDYARTADGLANQQRTMTANFEDIKATIGTGLLPMLSNLTGGFNDLLGGIKGIISGSGTMDEKMAGIGDLVAGFVNGLTAQLPSILQAGLQIVISLVTGIVQALPAMMPAIVALLMTLVNGIIALVPILLEAGLQIIIALAMGIAAALPNLIPAIVTMLLSFVTIIIANLPLLIEAALAIILGLVQGLIAALPQLIAMIPTLIIAIVDAIVTSLPLIITAAIQIILALIQGLIIAIPMLIAMIPQIIQGIQDALVAGWPMMKEQGLLAINMLIDGIKTMAAPLIESVQTLITDSIAKMKEKFAEMKQAGADFLTGFWDGIKSKFADILAGLAGWGQEIIDFVKKIFGIASPSKVMMGVGANMSKGFHKGILEGISKFGSLPDVAIQTSLPGAAGVAGVGGGTVNNYNLTMPTSNNPAEVAMAFELLRAYGSS